MMKFATVFPVYSFGLLIQWVAEVYGEIAGRTFLRYRCVEFSELAVVEAIEKRVKGPLTILAGVYMPGQRAEGSIVSQRCK
jgi:hypothetical protein